MSYEDESHLNDKQRDELPQNATTLICVGILALPLVEQVYWTMGHYDSVAIIEASDDESVAAMMLELTAEGNLRTSTLRAFDHDEMQPIVQRLG